MYMTGFVGSIASHKYAPTGVQVTADAGGTTYFRAFNLDCDDNTYDVAASSWGHAGGSNTGIGGPNIATGGLDSDEPTTFSFTVTGTISASGATSFSWATSTSGDTSAMSLSITSGATGSSSSISTEFTVTLDNTNAGDDCSIVFTPTATNASGSTDGDTVTVKVRTS